MSTGRSRTRPLRAAQGALCAFQTGQVHLSIRRLKGADFRPGFTRALGVVNDPAASWRALGNTIQKDVLESVCAPWIARLAAARAAAPPPPEDA